MWKFRKNESKQETVVENNEIFEDELEMASAGYGNREDQIRSEIERYENLLEKESDPYVRESYKNKIEKLDQELQEVGPLHR